MRWVTMMAAAVIGATSLMLGVLDVQIAQANPWWAIGGPLLLWALAAVIWFLERSEKHVVPAGTPPV